MLAPIPAPHEKLFSKFSDQEHAWLREEIAKGRSFVKLAQQLEEQGHAIEDCLSLVTTVGNYTPECFPVWEHFDYIAARDRTVRIVTKSMVPNIAVLDDVLSEDECDQLMALATPRLRPSLTHDARGRVIVDTTRRSDSAYLPHSDAPDLLTKLRDRFSFIMGVYVPAVGEALQVVRYQPGGMYHPHHDYFPEGTATLKNGGNRAATLLMYLNDDFEGGETFFPGLGMGIKPKKGSAVYFQLGNSQGQLDPQTLHGGAMVESGEKWIVTQWVRERRHEVQD